MRGQQLWTYLNTAYIATMRDLVGEEVELELEA